MNRYFICWPVFTAPPILIVAVVIAGMDAGDRARAPPEAIENRRQGLRIPCRPPQGSTAGMTGPGMEITLSKKAGVRASPAIHQGYEYEQYQNPHRHAA